MHWVRLGDIASKITKGTTPTSIGYDFVDEGINFIKIESITENGTFLQNKFAHITNECNEKLGRSQLNVNDILFSIAGAIGRTAIVSEDILPANTNQALAIIRVPEGSIDYSFLMYALESPALRKQYESQKQGVAQINLSLQNVSDFLIPKFGLDEQRRISAVLDKVSGLIAKRREQLDKLDELLKARFVEMFGDPVSNPKGWNIIRLSELGDCKNGMNFHTDDSGVEIHCLGVGDFKNLSSISDTAKLPIITLNEMPTNDYLLKNGDIVFVRSNGNKALVGRSVIVYPDDTPTTFSGFCIRFRIQNPIILPQYLLSVLKTASMRKQMTGRGANIQNLNQKILSELKIPVSPLPYQEEYIDFTIKIDKSKLTIQQSLDKLEVLKKALMQQYFE